MSYWSISILVFLLLLPAAGPWPTSGRLKAASIGGGTNVRAIDPVAEEILARALARSPSVQALIRQLEASDVIVHVDTAREMPAGIGGMTRFVTKSGGHRYLRVTVSQQLNWPGRIAMLAHELKHACEVAAAAVDDAAGMKRLFEADGFRTRGSREVFETMAAIRVEDRVRLELRERRTATLEAEPVVKFDH